MLNKIKSLFSKNKLAIAFIIAVLSTGVAGYQLHPSVTKEKVQLCTNDKFSQSVAMTAVYAGLTTKAELQAQLNAAGLPEKEKKFWQEVLDFTYANQDDPLSAVLARCLNK